MERIYQEKCMQLERENKLLKFNLRNLEDQYEMLLEDFEENKKIRELLIPLIKSVAKDTTFTTLDLVKELVAMYENVKWSL